MTLKVPVPVPLVNLPLMKPPSVTQSEGLLSCAQGDKREQVRGRDKAGREGAP